MQRRTSFLEKEDKEYVGRTTRHLSKRIEEQYPAWIGTGGHKSITSAIVAHLTDTNHRIDFNGAFRVIYSVGSAQLKTVRQRILATAEEITQPLPVLSKETTVWQLVVLAELYTVMLADNFCAVRTDWSSAVSGSEVGVYEERCQLALWGFGERPAQANKVMWATGGLFLIGHILLVISQFFVTLSLCKREICERSLLSFTGSVQGLAASLYWRKETNSS
ncbi:uncharacterized protein DEA37_0007717 [Paragonimus westermani]|uniref:Uncharacterized protein n=1 Tax=Paragonimus westermani TaxID=34504 RepID=A0A5J4NWS1_9TREM|nr:uncharacterized protein DEA37_0007717 [Paragonimus westermani]